MNFYHIFTDFPWRSHNIKPFIVLSFEECNVHEEDLKQHLSKDIIAYQYIKYHTIRELVEKLICKNQDSFENYVMNMCHYIHENYDVCLRKNLEHHLHCFPIYYARMLLRYKIEPITQRIPIGYLSHDANEIRQFLLDSHMFLFPRNILIFFDLKYEQFLVESNEVYAGNCVDNYTMKEVCKYLQEKKVSVSGIHEPRLYNNEHFPKFFSYSFSLKHFFRRYTQRLPLSLSDLIFFKYNRFLNPYRFHTTKPKPLPIQPNITILSYSIIYTFLYMYQKAFHFELENNSYYLCHVDKYTNLITNTFQINIHRNQIPESSLFIIEEDD